MPRPKAKKILMPPKSQDKIVEAMMARLDAGAVTLDGARRLDLRGAAIPVVIGRVCDDEPLLHTHQSLGRAYPDRVVRGLGAVAVICGAQRAILAVDQSWTRTVETFEGEASGTLLEVVPVPARYPMDPASLVCDLAQLQGKSVPAAGLGHVLVLDAVTLCDVAVALEGRYPLRRTVTVAGQVREPAVLHVPLGTSMADLVDACGGCSDAGWVPFLNGLLGGHAVGPQRVVDQDTRGVVILSHQHPAVVRGTTPLSDQVRRIPSACVNCRVCTDICPAFLAHGEHQPHQVMAAVSTGWPDSSSEPGGPLPGSLGCIGCGLCSTLCPGALRPAEVVREVARLLRQRGISTPLTEVLRPAVDRMGRRQSVARLTRRLGLGGMDRAPGAAPRSVIPDSITVPTLSPGGGLRVPVVSGGDSVAPGDRVSLAPVDTEEVDCLAPVSGTVTAVDHDDGVIIQIR